MRELGDKMKKEKNNLAFELLKGKFGIYLFYIFSRIKISEIMVKFIISLRSKKESFILAVTVDAKRFFTGICKSGIFGNDVMDAMDSGF